MPTGRLVFDGDNQYTEKQKRIHKLTQEVEQKIDAIPWVVDDANSISSTDALSARMGKVLQDQITELKSMWRFLSTWNCQTGLPTTDPLDNPYDFRVGDYYIVGVISQDTNYRPYWATYVHWQASVTVETDVVAINDWYLYDGNSWILQHQNAITIVVDSDLSTSSTNAVENRVITTALNTKQNVISNLAEIEAWANKGSTAVQPWDSLSVLDNTATGFQTAWDVASAISWKADTSTVTTLAWRVNTVESTISSQADAITALQQWGGATEQDVTELQTDVSVIQNDITNIQSELSNKVDASSLSWVATTWKASDLVNDAGFITSEAIWNWQISFVQWWINKWSFTLNQSWPATITLTDNDTTYDAISVANIQGWTNTTAWVVSPSTLASSTVRIASNTSWTKTQIWTWTQSEYEALSQKDPNVLYFTTDN